MAKQTLVAPFPYFGGKRRVSELVWQRFGNATNYIEPFFGSGAVLLGRPGGFDSVDGVETVNDANGFISNFWRAVQADPDAVAHHADWPVNECDLLPRHLWLLGQRAALQAQLEADPLWYDAQIAGWWVWGASCWIGSGWCSGEGPWQLVDGKVVKAGNGGVNRQLPHIGNAGRGVQRQLPHLHRAGQGVNQKLPHIDNQGRGFINHTSEPVLDWMRRLSSRLRRVRVACGDWQRVCNGDWTRHSGSHSVSAVFLDPPYAGFAEYYETDKSDDTVSGRVREWCKKWGDNKFARIALCGYEGEHNELDALGWDKVEWKSNGGYGGQSSKHDNPNARKERIWFSPACLNPGKQSEMW